MSASIAKCARLIASERASSWNRDERPETTWLDSLLRPLYLPALKRAKRSRFTLIHHMEVFIAMSIERRKLRKMLDDLVRTPADLNAFLLDYFPGTHRRIANNIDRVDQVNMLFQLEQEQAILVALNAFCKAKSDGLMQISDKNLGKQENPIVSSVSKMATTSTTPKFASNIFVALEERSWLIRPVVFSGILVSFFALISYCVFVIRSTDRDLFLVINGVGPGVLYGLYVGRLIIRSTRNSMSIERLEESILKLTTETEPRISNAKKILQNHKHDLNEELYNAELRSIEATGNYLKSVREFQEFILRTSKDAHEEIDFLDVLVATGPLLLAIIAGLIADYFGNRLDIHRAYLGEISFAISMNVVLLLFNVRTRQ